MIIQITNYCSTMCSHCSSSCDIYGKHMELDILNSVIDFIKRVDGSQILLISGGEPTEHPEFDSFIKIVRKSFFNSCIILISNGTFIFDINKTKKVKKLVSDKIINILQVRTHEKYYPNYNKIMSHKKDILFNKNVRFYDDGISLDALGRSKNIISKKQTSCSDILKMKGLITRKFDMLSLNYIIDLLKSYNRFCKPFIDINGEIRVGESNQCVSIGNVKDNNVIINKNLYNFLPCNKCGQVINTIEKLKSKNNRRLLPIIDKLQEVLNGSKT